MNKSILGPGVYFREGGGSCPHTHLQLSGARFLPQGHHSRSMAQKKEIGTWEYAENRMEVSNFINKLMLQYFVACISRTSKEPE